MKNLQIAWRIGYNETMQMDVVIGKTEYRIQAAENQTILSALQENGIHVVNAPCGGRGRCGKCTVTVEGRGEVLACMTKAEPGMYVAIPQGQLYAEKARIAEEGICRHYEPDGTVSLAAACDIGTTTVVCHLLDGKTGEKLMTVSEPSAQRGFGADVLSRIQAADAGNLKLLHEQITGQIRHMLAQMQEKTGRKEPIERLAIAGNTVMSHLVAGISPSSIGVTPFMPREFFGKEMTGEEVGIPECEKVYLAPAVAGFLGGDITSDLIAVMYGSEEKKTLLLDVGTNGEMAFGCENHYICCATAVGSAFEGAQMTMGMPAAPGAVSHVWLDKRRLRMEVIEGVQPCGICGSGLIDALAVMLEMGILDHTGLLKTPEEVSVAFRRYLGEYRGQPCMWLVPGKICMTQEDIRGLQLAKAAFAAGLHILLRESKTECTEIDRVILAGGFGSYLNKESAAKIGLIPKELLPVTESVGNAAGEGAVSAAISCEAREKLGIMKESMQYIELSSHPDFSEAYMQQMGF